MLRSLSVRRVVAVGGSGWRSRSVGLLDPLTHLEFPPLSPTADDVTQYCPGMAEAEAYVLETARGTHLQCRVLVAVT